MNIVVCSDDNYCQHLGVMLTSLFENLTSSIHVNVYIIDGGFSRENKEKLNNISYKYNTTFHFFNIDGTKYKDFITNRHFSEAIYYRIAIPEIVDDSVDKVIYLDSDMIVLDDIEKLWKIDISEYYLAAVETPNSNRKKALGMAESSKYFNSGLLIINVDRWRKEKITDKVIQYIKENQDILFYPDQDALNVVLQEKWYSLEFRWNQISLFHNMNITESSYAHEIQNALDNPAIVHFTEASKPWQYLNSHPNKKDYFYYLNLTGWREYKYPSKSILDDKLNNKRVIIFGCGKNGIDTALYLEQEKVVINYFVDNNKFGQSMKIQNRTVEVKPPSVLIEENKEDVFVIIASMYYEEISEELNKIGFIRNRNYIVKGFEHEVLP